MYIGSPKEIFNGEARVAMTPDSALQLQKLGYQCAVESGAGALAGFADQSYRAAGVTVLDGAEALYRTADVIAKVRPPNAQEVARLESGKTLISLFDPAQDGELLEAVRKTGATVIAMDMVPRISRARKMDALSSMANVAGYSAVIAAANNFGRFFTGQMKARSRPQGFWSS
jgi:H+-translocating NAD(P) transhydrogenase subunit alpha